jgi:hypothetical protein
MDDLPAPGEVGGRGEIVGVPPAGRQMGSALRGRISPLRAHCRGGKRKWRSGRAAGPVELQSARASAARPPLRPGAGRGVIGFRRRWIFREHGRSLARPCGRRDTSGKPDDRERLWGHQADGIAIWIAWRTKSGRYIIFEVSLVVPRTTKLLWPHGEWRQKRRRALKQAGRTYGGRPRARSIRELMLRPDRCISTKLGRSG